MGVQLARGTASGQLDAAVPLCATTWCWYAGTCGHDVENPGGALHGDMSRPAATCGSIRQWSLCEERDVMPAHGAFSQPR